jgi:hypothetical protein
MHHQSEMSDHQRQAFARAVVDDGQDTKPAAIGELIGDKVEATSAR